MASTTNAAATIEDIQRDMLALRSDMAKLAGQVTEVLSNGGGEAIARLKERVGEMQDGLDETLSDVGARSREALGDVSDRIGDALQESIQEHPLTTIGLAVGLGFLFGATWRR
jgi:ElaB/YqjD/DUF883 family membrane-anchored ribosome-binding protein